MIPSQLLNCENIPKWCKPSGTHCETMSSMSEKPQDQRYIATAAHNSYLCATLAKPAWFWMICITLIFHSMRIYLRYHTLTMDFCAGKAWVVFISNICNYSHNTNHDVQK